MRQFGMSDAEPNLGMGDITSILSSVLPSLISTAGSVASSSIVANAQKAASAAATKLAQAQAAAEAAVARQQEAAASGETSTALKIGLGVAGLAALGVLVYFVAKRR